MVRKVLVADDDAAFGRAAVEVLRRGGYDVTWVPDAASALAALERDYREVVVADVYMPGNAGLELLRSLAQLPDPPSVVVVTGQPHHSTAIEALRQAAVDYLPKPIDAAALRTAVARGFERREAYRALQDARTQLGALAEALLRARAILGATAQSSEAAAVTERSSELARSPALEPLSAREREVVQAIAKGWTAAQIASALHISEHTARNHMKTIYRKLGVHSRAQLISQLAGWRT